MIKFREYNYKSFCLSIVALVLAFGGVGILLIQRLQDEDESQFEKQVIGYAVGIIIMLIVAMIDYHFICKFFIPLYILNLGMLLFCKFTDISMGLPIYGDKHYTAKRWIEISVGGRSIEFMPSELSKIIMILFLAKLFQVFYRQVKKFYVLVLAAGLMAVPTFLILIQPDLSTSIVMFSFFAIMVFAAGTNYKHLIPIILIGIPLSIFLFWYIQQDYQGLLNPYQQGRVLAILNPTEYADEMFQQQNAALAIKEGGVFGKLLTGDMSKRATDYVPVVESDFIFSAIGEEFGFVGMVMTISGYCLFGFLGIRIARKAKDYLGMMIATGITSLITVQAFVNIGVVTSLLPNTGIPLPFISSGLTALLSNLVILGILLNISLQPKQEKEKEPIGVTDFGLIH